MSWNIPCYLIGLLGRGSPHSNDCWPGLFPSHLRENLFVIDIMWDMRQWESTLFIPEKLTACIKVSGCTNLLLLLSWSPGWRRGKGSKRHIEKFYCIMWALSLIYGGSEPHGTNYRSELGIAFNKKNTVKYNMSNIGQSLWPHSLPLSSHSLSNKEVI